MSNVPKSKRKKHDFETTKQMTLLRKDITELAINDFGYDPDRYQKMIDRYARARKDQPNVEVTVSKMQFKHDTFYDAFIVDETEYIIGVWRDIVREFEIANSIYPSGAARLAEFCERRIHLDRCIGHIRDLKTELQYIAETLPVDKNKYDNLADRIMALIALVKGVRQASNKFLKAKTDEKSDS